MPVVFSPLLRDRSSWVEYALAVAAVTVLITTGILVARAPAFISQVSVLGIGEIFSDTDKIWVLLLWLCGGFGVLITLWLDRRARVGAIRPAGRRALSIASLAGFGLTIVFATWKAEPFANFWIGYSLDVLLMGAAIATLIVAFVLRVRLNDRLLLTMALVVVFGMGVLPLLQTSITYINASDNAFTFDELLAPSNGRLAGFNYITQYQTLLGLPLAIATALAPAQFVRNPESFASAHMVLMQLVTLVTAVWAVVRVAPRQVRWLVPFIIVGMAYMIGETALVYYADLPVRFILPTLLLAAIVFAGSRRFSSESIRVPLLLGILAGAVAFNNLDYGIAAALSGGVALLVGASNPFLGVAAAIALGCAVGLFNGIIVAKLRISSLMATVGTMLLVVGIGFLLTGGRGVVYDDIMTSIALDAPIAGVFSLRSLLTIVVTVLLAAFVRFTRPGVAMYAAGGGRHAAEVLGVRVDRALIIAFVFSGAAAALAGALLGFSLASAAPLLDLDILLQGATAALAGGVLLVGGVGSPAHAAFGAVFITVLNTGLSISGFPSATIQLANGVVLMVVLAVTYANTRVRRARGVSAPPEDADSVPEPSRIS